MTKYRVGIIGLGRIGFSLGFDRRREQPAAHSRAFGENPYFTVSGGCDIVESKRQIWQKRYPSAKVYSRAEDLLRDSPWDVVVVAVDEEQHLPVMEQVLAHRPRLVVLEKPVAPNLKDALEINKQALEYGVPVAVNHERRFAQNYLFMKDLIASREMGSLCWAQGDIFTGQYAWYRSDERLGQGTLIHDGTHLADIIMFLTGQELQIQEVMLTGVEPDGIQTISGSGYLGQALVTLNVGGKTGHYTFEIEMVFTQGRIRIGNGILEVWRAQESPYYEGFYSLLPGKRVPRFRKTGYFSGMVQNCADFLEGKAKLESSLEEGIQAMKVLEKAVNLTRKKAPHLFL